MIFPKLGRKMKFLNAISVFCLLSIVCGQKNVTKFPEGLFGSWMPTDPPQSVLGPLAYEMLTYPNSGFSAFRDNKTNDVWFTVLYGQVFHTRESAMQYCFGQNGTLMEQSPFEVDSIDDTQITYCWRSTMRRMPTHADSCSGCDCAKIVVKLTSTDTMEFTFWQSPPVIHAHLKLKRSGPPPTIKAVLATMDDPYKQCDFRDKWGPNLPNATEEESNEVTKPKLAGGCARGLLEQVKTNEQLSAFYKQYMDGLEAPKLHTQVGEANCYQLNGYNLYMNTLRPEHKFDIPDVKLQFVDPEQPCNPCDVSYSVSAAIEENQYIALGFKGHSWEADFPHPPEHPMRPCYFGMCVNDYDNYTSDRLAVGYASSSVGACLREMVAKNIIGTPLDAEFDILKNKSVERKGGRTIIRFTISQNFPKEKPTDGWFRTMWAIGDVFGSGGEPCNALLSFHGIKRGVSPINWLATLGSTPCKYDPYELPLE